MFKQKKEGIFVLCPFCKKEVEEGKFCSNCSKPLYPKWYQKNSPLTITIMILSVIFFIVCVWFSFGDSENVNTVGTDSENVSYENEQEMIPKTYESVLEEYSIKLREATPKLIEQYKNEAEKNTKGLEGLAEISTNKVEKLAEISTDGISEMAELMHTTGSGKYSEYEEWAGKLQNVYMEESQKIMDVYMDSSLN